MKLLSKTLLGLFLVGCTWNVSQAETLTSQAIFGSGNSNTLFNVVQSDGIEIGLRAKVRGSNDDSIVGENTPQNVYYIDHVVDPGNSDLASWNLDWSVNTNFDGSGSNLANYTYSLSFEFEPTSGSPVSNTPFNPLTHYTGYDNSYGNNSTPQGAGVEPFPFSVNTAGSLRSTNNVAQNSLNIGFDYSYSLFGIPVSQPPVFPLSVIQQTGIYTITLSVFDGSSPPLVTNQIQVYAGVEPPSAVPEPTSMAILGMGVLGFVGGGVARHRLKQKKEASDS